MTAIECRLWWHREFMLTRAVQSSGAVSFELAKACSSGQRSDLRAKSERSSRTTVTFYRHVQSCRAHYRRTIERMRRLQGLHGGANRFKNLARVLICLGEATSMTVLYRWEGPAYCEEAIVIMEKDGGDSKHTEELASTRNFLRTANALSATCRTTVS